MLPSAREHPIIQVPGRCCYPIALWRMSWTLREQVWDIQERGLTEPMSQDWIFVPVILMQQLICFWTAWNLVLCFNPKISGKPMWVKKSALKLRTLHPVFPTWLASTLWLIAEAKQAQFWICLRQLAFKKVFCHQFCLSYKVRNSPDMLSMSLC